MELLLKKIYSLVDLTSLNENDDVKTIVALCQKASTPLGHVAAICIYPQFVATAKQLLASTPQIKIATVSNFPQGKMSLPVVLNEIKTALRAGADEIDMVMPYQDYLAGKYQAVHDFVKACKEACGHKILKVILETGALQKPEIIGQASEAVILAGADFIKTSTGKIAVGATLEAAEIMLKTIRRLKLSRTVGFKAAGGIRTLKEAMNYIHLAEKIMGKAWLSPQTFRIGASRLLDELLSYPTI